MCQEPKELSSGYPTGALMGVHAQLVHPASFKKSFKDLEMFYPGFLFYHNIIYIVFQLLMHHVMEDGCHGTLASAFLRLKGITV